MSKLKSRRLSNRAVVLSLVLLLPVAVWSGRTVDAADKPYLYIVLPKASVDEISSYVAIDIMLRDPDGVESLEMTLDGKSVISEGVHGGKLRLALAEAEDSPANLLAKPSIDTRFRADLVVEGVGEHELVVTARDATGAEAVKSVRIRRVSAEEVYKARKAAAAKLEAAEAARAAAEAAARKAEAERPKFYAYEQRMTASDHERGGDRVVKAIDASLDWLARHQSKDGSWSCGQFPATCVEGERCVGGIGYWAHDTGLTGLAVLAFLGAGHTHQYGDYRDAMKDALQWMIDNQDAEGCIGHRKHQAFTYGHALASQALFEAYAMTRDETFAAPCRAALKFILEAQNPEKAWRYGVRTHDSDTSVTAWMMQALAAARTAGFEVDADAVAVALKFVDDVTSDTAHVGYTVRGIGPVRPVGLEEKYDPDHSESLTAAGMLCHLRFPSSDARTGGIMRKAAERCLAKLPAWELPKIDVYYWYYGAYFLHAYDERAWKTWNSRHARVLVENQRTDDGCAHGSWDPIGAWGKEGGRVYTTAINALSLEVPMRYAVDRRKK